MELISALFRNDFREFCVTYLVLRQIDDIFTMAGVKRGTLPSDRFISGQRRTLVEEYFATLNWAVPGDADKFLKVVGYAIAQRYQSDEPQSRLREFCEREGFIVDGIQIYRGASKPAITQNTVVSPAQLETLKQQLLQLNQLEPKQRGFAFERFLQDLFEAHGLAARHAFRLVGEQIDGSFELNSDIYLLEAKWQSKPTAQDDLLIFREKCESKSTWTRGLFVSHSGFSSDGIAAFARGRATNIVGMTGEDLYFILNGEIPLIEAITRKVRQAAETGEFHVPIFQLLRR